MDETKDRYEIEKNKRDSLKIGCCLVNGKKQQYKIESYIAAGGSSLVYRARNNDGIVVIVKEFYPLLSKRIERKVGNILIVPMEIKETYDLLLEQEKSIYELSKRIISEGLSSNNPHSWTYIDSFQANNTYYQICQDVAGMTLSNLIEEGKYRLEELIDYINLGILIIPAVNAVHQQNLVHCDLKPSNLYVVASNPPTIRCIDFGSAVPVGSEKIVSATYNYASPEINFMFSKEKTESKIDGGVQYSMDTYSILAILYHLLTGVFPKERKDKNQFFKREMSKLFDISDESYQFLIHIFSNGLSENRRLRYQFLSDLEKDLLKLKELLQKKIYLHYLDYKDVTPKVHLNESLEKIFEEAIDNDTSFTYFDVPKDGDYFETCTQLFSYFKNKKIKAKLIPITYRESLKTTLFALPFGAGKTVPQKEELVLELRSLSKEYYILILGYQYNKKDKKLLKHLQDNNGLKIWFFAEEADEEIKQKRIGDSFSIFPTKKEKYVVCTNFTGTPLKYFVASMNYGLNRVILSGLDGVDMGVVNDLCLEGSLYRFGDIYYANPQILEFYSKMPAEERNSFPLGNLTFVKMILDIANKDEYFYSNYYQKLTVSDFELCSQLLVTGACTKKSTEIMSFLNSWIDKERFGSTLLEVYEKYINHFWKVAPKDIQLLGENIREFCMLMYRSGDRSNKLKKYRYFLHEIVKQPMWAINVDFENKQYEKVIDEATVLIELFGFYGKEFDDFVNQYLEMRAEAYAKREDYYHAERDYTELIDKGIKKYAVYIGRAKVYERIRKFDKAEDDYTQAIDLNPQDDSAWNLRGTFFHDCCKLYSNAEADYLRAIKINPYNEVYFSNLSSTQRRLKKYAEAEEDVNKALEINSQHAPAWNQKGVLYKELKKYEKSEECYQKAVELDSYEEAYYANLSGAQCSLKKYAEAEENVNKALEINPQYALAWNRKGRIYMDLGKYEKSEECYQKATELDPYEEAHYTYLSGVQCSLKKYVEAEKNVNKALEINSQYALAWNQKGVLYKELKNYEKSEECYQKAAELDPYEEAYFVNLSVAQRRLKKYAEAEENVNKALAINSQCAPAWNIKGWIYVGLGKYEKSEECYQKAAELDSYNATYFNNVSGVQLSLKKYVEAEENVNMALKLNPQDAYAWKTKGNLWFHRTDKDLTEKWNEAEKCYQKVLLYEANNVVYITKLATVQLYLHQFSDSEKSLLKAIKLDSQYAPAWNGLGDIYSNLGGSGNLEKALQYYEKASQLNPLNESYKNDVEATKEEIEALKE